MGPTHYTENSNPPSYIKSYSKNNLKTPLHLLYCPVCQQQFQSEKSFERHNRSRKHFKRASGISEFCANITNSSRSKVDLLPNSVIQTLISDLNLQFNSKDEFFRDIELLENDELNPEVTASNSVQHINRTGGGGGVDAAASAGAYNINESIITVRQIPPMYPCAMCFQSLDSQADFERHMHGTHLRFAFDLKTNS